MEGRRRVSIWEFVSSDWNWAWIVGFLLLLEARQ